MVTRYFQASQRHNSAIKTELNKKLRCLFTSGDWGVWGAGGVLVFGGQSLLCTSWSEHRAGGGAGASAAPVQALSPGRAALTPPEELVGHGGSDGVQAAAAAVRARGARIAASHPGLLERVAGS